MSPTLKLGSALAAVVLILVACAGPAATPKPSAPAATPTAVAATPTAVAATPTAAPPTEAASPSEPPVASTGPEVTPAPTPPPAAVAGTLTIWADTVRAPILKTVSEAFTAQYNVPVQVYEIGFGDIRDQLILRGPTGEGPDIIIGAHDWLGQLVQAGVVEPLDLGAKASSFEQVGLDAFSYGGVLYGLPYVSEAIALYYNKDLVPTPPTTWDELKTMAKDLQDAGTVDQGYCLQKGDPYHTEPILTGFGGYIFGKNDDGSYNPQDVGLDSEGGLAYAEELDSLVKDGLLKDNVDYAACTTMMTTGKSAFWITGPWALNDFRTSGVNYGVAPIPTMDEQPRPFVGVQGMMVSSFAPNKLLAQTFLTEYVATDDTMAALYEADPRIPVWKSLKDTITDPDILAFSESAVNGDPLPAIPEMSSVWTAWTDAINLIFGQGQEPDSAMTDAAAKIRDLIGPGASPAP
jgi:maltose-binding protein MalE